MLLTRHFLQWLTGQHIHRAEPVHHIDDPRARALAILNLVMAGLPSMYIPAMLLRPEHLITPIQFAIFYATCLTLLLLDVWLCYTRRPGAHQRHPGCIARRGRQDASTHGRGIHT